MFNVLESFWPTNFKDWLQIVQSSIAIIQALIIIVGVFVAIKLFEKRRKIYPHLNLSQEVSHYVLSPEKILLRTKISLENKGEMLLSVGKGEIWLQQVFPILSTPETTNALAAMSSNNTVKPDAVEVEWPLVQERSLNNPFLQREIEPGETDELDIDFIVDNEKAVVIVYTLFENPKKKNGEGWQTSTVYEIPENEELELDSTQGGIVVTNLNSTSQPVKKVISPDPDDISKGGSPKPKPVKVQQPAKTSKKKP